MTIRVDSPYFHGSVIVGVTGLGVLAEHIPGAGEHGPAFVYPSLSFPADAGKEIRAQIVNWPSGALTAYEDTSFEYQGLSSAFTFQLYVDGVAVGAPATITLTLSIEPVIVDPARGRIVVAGRAPSVTIDESPEEIMVQPVRGRAEWRGRVPSVTVFIPEPPLVYPPGVYPPLGHLIQSREKWADEAKFERTTNGQLRARSLWTQRRLESLQLQHIATRRELEALLVFYDENRMQVIDVRWEGDGQQYPVVFRTPPQVECLGGDNWRVTCVLEGT